jgi:hypothetical protein
MDATTHDLRQESFMATTGQELSSENVGMAAAGTAYEAPAITSLGTLAELTLGGGYTRVKPGYSYPDGYAHCSHI